VPAAIDVSSRCKMREAGSMPEPVSLPSVSVNATDGVVYQAGGDVSATVGAVGAVVSLVIVIGVPVDEFDARSWATIACPAGELVAPAVHE